MTKNNKIEEVKEKILWLVRGGTLTPKGEDNLIDLVLEISKEARQEGYEEGFNEAFSPSRECKIVKREKKLWIKDILGVIETMKNHNEMLEMEDVRFTEGFEKALAEIKKIIETMK